MIFVVVVEVGLRCVVLFLVKVVVFDWFVDEIFVDEVFGFFGFVVICDNVEEMFVVVKGLYG